MPGLEIWQMILVKCGANKESGLQCRQNLVKKVNAKKIDLTLIASCFNKKALKNETHFRNSYNP